MSIDMDETFSSIDFVTQCLVDTKRTTKFQEAIEKVVRPGDVVLDSGTGSAVLALMAARAGAKKVIAVEYDPFIARIAAQNIARNGYSHIIDIVVGDVRNAHFPEGTKFDVVIMEMLTTGMIDEFQVWAINNLHRKGYADQDTRFIPARQDTYAAPAYADYTNYGFDMRMVRHVWEPHSMIETKPFAEAKLLNSISFDTINALEHKSELTFEVVEDGVLNTVYLTSNSILADGVEVAETAALNAPVVFPIASDVTVAKGDTVRVAIHYQFGGGFRNFSADITVV